VLVHAYGARRVVYSLKATLQSLHYLGNEMNE
jgi:hypothetical protein